MISVRSTKLVVPAFEGIYMACIFRRFTVICLAFSISLTATTIFAADKSEAESEARILESAKYLASDELEGRGVGTKGIDKAADYLAAQFTRLGLKTDLFDGSPFQKFTIVVKSELGEKEHNRLTFVGPAKEGTTEPVRTELELGKQFTPLAAGGTGKVDGDLVFAGYGISDPKNGYDDYAGIDAKDKIVLLIRKEPQQADDKSVFDGARPSQHATFMRKFANASEHGAKAVIIVNDDFDAQTKLAADKKAWREELEKLSQLREQLAAKAEISAEEETKQIAAINKLAESIATRGKRMATGYDELLAFAGAGEESGHKKMPVWFCLRGAIDPIIKQQLGKDLATIEREIDANLKPQSKDLGIKVDAEASVKQQEAEIKNVVAVLEGEGPHADETIVIGAHYDHLGFGGLGSLAPWTNEIHNGADDNGSGTAALLETAERLATSGKKPSRRIVFIAFTGEERGLLGSAYYCRHPRFSLEKTVAMLNMDMVGRLTDDKLIVYGTGTAAEFDPMVEELTAKHGFKITKHEGGFGPSDHASFYAQKIPVIHLFTGNHNDYHRPSDDADKLNIAGMRRVVDLLVDMTHKIDLAETRPAYREVKKIESIGGGGGDRPYFGSIPDYASDAEGLALTDVVKDGPAEKAGLKGGDVIVGLGESKITGIEDFDSALRKFKPGDTTKVKVLRDGKTVELDITLGKRP